jgi:hypothetical protein
LIFEEVLGPITGNPADADPSRRHAVRLTKVTPGEDALYKQPLVEIEWADEDALPFPFCISAIGEAPECKYLETSVARQRILVDHGKPSARKTSDRSDGEHSSNLRMRRSSWRYSNCRRILSPGLSKTPLTFRESLPADEPAKSQWTPLLRC